MPKYNLTEDSNEWTPPILKQIYNSIASIVVSDNAESFDASDHKAALANEYSEIIELTLTVTYPSGKSVVYGKGITPEHSDYQPYTNNEYTIPITSRGEYKFRFDLYYIYNYISYTDSTSSSFSYYRTNRSTYIYFGSDQSKITPYTMNDVIDRVLSVTPTRHTWNSNKYNFDDSSASDWTRIESPEFCFDGKTLFEIFNQIGQYESGGMWPELRERTIRYRRLWNGKKLTEDELLGLCVCDADFYTTRNINQYCTHTDSYVQNLVGINDSLAGSKIEPYEGGYKTTRSASGSAITEETAIISTDEAIYQHIALNMGEADGQMVGDLSSYVYEEGEYNSLSDTTISYPMSKAYAMEWTQLSAGIGELSHRVEATSNVTLNTLLTRPALANIVKSVADASVGDTLSTYIAGLVGMKNNDSFANLMFQETYIPVTSARLKAYKEYTDDFHYEEGLIYNQGTTMADSEYYNESLKSTVNRLGNMTAVGVYVFRRLEDVPEVGTIVEIDGTEYSVYNTSSMIYPTHVNTTIAYVVYAALSQFVGLKSEWKDSDISTKRFVDRKMNYSSFLVFTHDEIDREVQDQKLSSLFLENVLNFTSRFPATCAKVTTYDEDGEEINTVLLSTTTLGGGNQLLFHFDFKNNYSAGEMSQEASEGSVDPLSGTQYNRAQKSVRYCDLYGRAESMSFELLRTGPTPENGACLKDTDEEGNESIITDAETVRRAIGYSLPQYLADLTLAEGEEWEGEAIVTYKDILLKKNSSEKIGNDLQFHFRTNIRNFRIGSGVSNFNSLIGGSCKRVWLYGLANEISYGTRQIELSPYVATILATDLSYTVDVIGQRDIITLPESVNHGGYKAWAFIGLDNQNNYQLIFGENLGDNSEFNRTVFLYHYDPMQQSMDDRVTARFYSTPAIRQPYPLQSVITSVYNAEFHDKAITIDYRYKSSTNDLKYAKFYDEAILQVYPTQSHTNDLKYAKFYDNALTEDYPYASNKTSINSAYFYDNAIKKSYPHISILNGLKTAYFYDSALKTGYPSISILATVKAYFYNESTLLTTQKVAFGAKVTYTGTTPTKASTAEGSYSFNGWSPNIDNPLKEDTTFYAQFTLTKATYTITVKHIDSDNVVLMTTTQKGTYGETITISPYTGWSTEKYTLPSAITYTITGNDTVYLVYNIRSYSVKFYVDQELYNSQTVKYGSYASTPATPTKASTSYYTYTFSGWDKNPASTAITGDTTFNGTFTANYRYYTVTANYVNQNGDSLGSNSYSVRAGGELTITPPAFSYYDAPESQTVSNVIENKTITFVYQGFTFAVNFEAKYNPTVDLDIYENLPTYTTVTRTAQYPQTISAIPYTTAIIDSGETIYNEIANAAFYGQNGSYTEYTTFDLVTVGSLNNSLVITAYWVYKK